MDEAIIDFLTAVIKESPEVANTMLSDISNGLLASEELFRLTVHEIGSLAETACIAKVRDLSIEQIKIQFSDSLQAHLTINNAVN